MIERDGLFGLGAKTEADEEEKQKNPDDQSNEKGFQFLDPSGHFFYPPLKFLITALYSKCNDFFNNKNFFHKGDGTLPETSLKRFYKSGDLLFIFHVTEFTGLNRDGHFH